MTTYKADIGQEGPIRCILFSEFHPTAGPKITYQVPEDYISKEVFDVIRDFIIPKKLGKRVITVTVPDYKIVGYPVRIHDKKYERNALIFNLCFVSDANVRTVHYEPVVKKLSEYLITLEMQSEFISREESKKELPSLLRKMLQDLNSEQRMCTVEVENGYTMYLKIVPVRPDPRAIEDHDVPVFVDDRKLYHNEQWDLTTQQVLDYINGFNHVAKISAEADVEKSMVKACVQNLVYYKVVDLVSIFQYSNVYRLSPEISKLAESRQLQEDCVQHVARSDHSPPTFDDVFTFFCGFKHGVTVKDLCLRYDPQSLNINEKKLVQFGMLKGIIIRVHKYPVCIRECSQSLRTNSLYTLFNGSLCYDQICCQTGLTFQQLDEVVERDPSVLVLWR